ncbi:hypothetical protein T09_12573 [Trichinella sp. T9]|nr:hypothetical protein T09_12573 [Trichinella sp. T9]
MIYPKTLPWQLANSLVYVRYTSDLRIVDNVASAAKTRCKKLAANKARLNRLLTELEELSIDAVDDNVLDGQIELTPALYIGLESAPRNTCSQYWLAVLSVFRRDELEVLDEPSRSAYGRTIERRTHPNRSGGIRLIVRDERYNAGSRTLGARSSWRIVVAESVNRKTSAKEIAVYESWYPDRSPRRGRLHPIYSLFIQYTCVLPDERTSDCCCNSDSNIGPPSRSRTSDLWIVDTMASAMKTRSKKLVALNDRLNRLLAELDDLCIGSADAFEVEEQVSLMEETFRAADALQTEVELDLEGEERQAAIDDWAACHQRYRVGKSRARARMVEARGECPIDGDNVSAGRPAVRTGNGRLPEVTLPNFEEKVLEFPSFWALFEANIHKRGDLDNATKFTYLLSSTEGTARSAIEGIPLTPENYTQAVDILKAANGDTRASGGPVEGASMSRDDGAGHPVTGG